MKLPTLLGNFDRPTDQLTVKWTDRPGHRKFHFQKFKEPVLLISPEVASKNLTTNFYDICSVAVTQEDQLSSLNS